MQDTACEACSKLRELEPRIDAQLSSLRADIKQALALAASSSREQADEQANIRVRECEKRLMTRLHSE